MATGLVAKLQAEMNIMPGMHAMEDSPYEIACKVRDYYMESVKHEKFSINFYLEAGRWLKKLKEACGHGEWGKQLQNTRIPQQRASELIRLVDLPPDEVMKLLSYHDLRNYVYEQRGESKLPKKGNLDDNSQPQSSNGVTETPKTEPVSPVDQPPKPPRVTPREEPGCDDDTFGIDFQKPIESVRKRLPEMIDKIAKRRDVPKAKVEAWKKRHEQLMAELIELASAPMRKPFVKPCNLCKVDITLAIIGGKWKPFDGTGGYALKENQMVKDGSGSFGRHNCGGKKWKRKR